MVQHARSPRWKHSSYAPVVGTSDFVLVSFAIFSYRLFVDWRCCWIWTSGWNPSQPLGEGALVPHPSCLPGARPWRPSAWHSRSFSEASYNSLHPEAIHRAQEHHQYCCTHQHQQGVPGSFFGCGPFECFSQLGFFLHECSSCMCHGFPSTCLSPSLFGRLHDPRPRGPCTCSSHQPRCTDGWFGPCHVVWELSHLFLRFSTCTCMHHASSATSRHSFAKHVDAMEVRRSRESGARRRHAALRRHVHHVPKSFFSVGRACSHANTNCACFWRCHGGGRSQAMDCIGWKKRRVKEKKREEAAEKRMCWMAIARGRCEDKEDVQAAMREQQRWYVQGT